MSAAVVGRRTIALLRARRLKPTERNHPDIFTRRQMLELAIERAIALLDAWEAEIEDLEDDGSAEDDGTEDEGELSAPDCIDQRGWLLGTPANRWQGEEDDTHD